jgi:hypothetical protein
LVGQPAVALPGDGVAFGAELAVLPGQRLVPGGEGAEPFLPDGGHLGPRRGGDRASQKRPFLGHG